MLELIRAKAFAKASEEGLLQDYSGAVEPLNIRGDIDRKDRLIRKGYLSRYDERLYPGLLLNLACSRGPLVDLSAFLPIGQSDRLHEDALVIGMRVSAERTMQLLHANYPTRFYFDCDRFLCVKSKGRYIAAESFRMLVDLLSPRLLSCIVCPTPDGLLGAYPLCFYLSLHCDLSIAAIMYRRGDEKEPLGGQFDWPSPSLTVQDVVTTGQSIIVLERKLRELGIAQSGALAVFDRLEGGRSRLEECSIPVIPLMSLDSLRRYCLHPMERNSHKEQLDAKVAEFLQVSKQLSFLAHECGMQPQSRARLAIAPTISPAAELLTPSYQLPASVRSEQINRIKSIVGRAISQGCSMLVFPELTVPLECAQIFREVTSKHRIIIIGGSEYDGLGRNIALIAINGRIFEQAKIIRSPYDLGTMTPGTTVNVFKNTSVGSLAVLVCSDQVNFQIMDGLKDEIDILVVVARNKSMSTFASIAIGDSYRIYSYIIVANDAEVGKSLVVAPARGPNKVTWLNAAPGDDMVYNDLCIGELKSGSTLFHRKIPFDHTIPEEKPR